MQIVIDIPEEIINMCKDNKVTTVKLSAEYFRYGTPLPKGHGNLVDVGQCDRKLFYKECNGKDSLITVEEAFDMLEALPVVIEADMRGDTDDSN